MIRFVVWSEKRIGHERTAFRVLVEDQPWHRVLEYIALEYLLDAVSLV